MTDEGDPKQHTAASTALETSITEAFPGMDQELKQTLASMGAALAVVSTAEKKKQLPAKDSVPVPAKEWQFPLPFGEDTRAVSNALARSSLFAAVKERLFFKAYETVGQVDGVKIEYKGEQLNQDDHDTFLQLIAMANHKAFGFDICQPVNPVLRGIGRTTHQEQRRQLFDQISRLVSGTIRLTMPNDVYEGHLLDDARTPHYQTILPQFRRHLIYRLNPKFARLYTQSAYTLINAKNRQQIKGRGSELAKWLHLIIESHVEMFPTKVETYHRDSRSATKELKHFRAILRQALALLKEQQIITGWNIDPDSDLVSIERTPSRSQQKHIAKKQGRAACLQSVQEYNPARRHQKPRV